MMESNKKGMADSGPMKKPITRGGEPVRRTTVEIPAAMWLAAKTEAATRGVTLRGLILEALKAELAKKKPKPSA
jgi:hypothetical protein